MAISDILSSFSGKPKSKTVDFSGAYRDSTRGMTLKALQQRQRELQESSARAMAPRQIGHPLQGVAQIADVISSGVREGRAANQEAAGRARFAELLAGGLAPDEIGEAMGLDPETAMKYQERTWAQEDVKNERTYTEGRDLTKHGWDVDAAAARVKAEQEQEKLRDLNEDERAEFNALVDDPLGMARFKLNKGLITEEQYNETAAQIERAEAADIGKAERDANAPYDELGQAAQDFKDGRITAQEYEERKAKINAPPASAVTFNTGEIEARKKLAAELGMQPGTPEYTEYVATGDISKPSNDRVSVNEQKEIMDAEDMVLTNQQTIDTLNSVLTGPEGQSLNERAGSGLWATPQAFLARNDPTGFFDDAKGQATTELQNKVILNAVNSLKAIFGAMPTEGERQVLLDLQASVDKSPPERKIILENAIALAKNKLAINRQRADQLRSREFFKPGGGTSTTAPAAPPADGGWTVEEVQ